MKILVVRFSSIGDIVLTSPVLSAVKNQLPNCELHFLTKEKFIDCIKDNPNVDKVHTIEKSIDEVIGALKKEQFDRVIDLHNNIRTKSLKTKLSIPMNSFVKLNVKKWLLVKLKWDKMPNVHVVDRYFGAVESIGVRNNGEKVEFHIGPSAVVDISDYGLEEKGYVSVAIGAQFATKRMPTDKLIELLKKIDSPIVLLGGSTDETAAQHIHDSLISQSVVNLAGKLSLQQSASVVQQSRIILTHDTGMMHIASAYDIPIVSVWGNTVPQFGMYPYRPNEPDSYSIHQVDDLPCRPCSKIGYGNCPKKHFKCMNDQNLDEIANALRQ